MINKFNIVLYWADSRLTKSVDTAQGNTITTSYAYDAKGMRIIKDGPYGKSIYIDTGCNPAVKTGIYTYKVSTHGPNYFNKHKALKINNDLSVPTQKQNPKQGGKNIATGIRVHVGNKMNESNKGITGSAGCWVVPAVIESESNYDPKNISTWNYYNKFISSFKEGDTGIAVIVRTDDIKNFFKNLFNENKK